MRVLVSVDMEGIAGVLHGDEIRPDFPTAYQVIELIAVLGGV